MVVWPYSESEIAKSYHFIAVANRIDIIFELGNVSIYIIHQYQPSNTTQTIFANNILMQVYVII